MSIMYEYYTSFGEYILRKSLEKKMDLFAIMRHTKIPLKLLQGYLILNKEIPQSHLNRFAYMLDEDVDVFKNKYLQINKYNKIKINETRVITV